MRDGGGWTRRGFLAALASGAVGFAGCVSTDAELANDTGGGDARLTARPSTPTATVSPGTLEITPSNPNDGALVVPASYLPTRPTPLVVALHGAGQGPSSQLTLLGPYAASRGFLLLAIGARGLTWDVFTSRFSYDVTFIDGALNWAFQRCAVDATRITLCGFSDGASYTLGLGLANGDLFTRVAAFSPGFIPRADTPAAGKPPVFVSHGRQDAVLPIDGASRKIVPGLRSRGYDVTYVEFDGGHAVPPAVSDQAVSWMSSS